MKPLMMVASVHGQITGRIRELVQTAKTIARCHGDASPKLILVLAGENPRDIAGQIAAETGLNVLALVLPGNSVWDLLKSELIRVAREIDPAMVLFSQTTMAREVGPALAISLGGVSVANVSALKTDHENVIFTRPVMDNTRVQQVQVEKERLVVASLAAGVVVKSGAAPNLPAGEDGGTTAGSVSSTGGGRVTVREVLKPDGQMIQRLEVSTRQGTGEGKLSRAAVVVAAGRGIGEKENLETVAAFTAAVPRAVMAASRPLVDQGWVGYDRQVGITGAVVSPELYIALGISGSSQHLAGMAGSKWVVSVNNNSEAPICRHSDLCIQADVLAFIQAFLEPEADDTDKK